MFITKVKANNICKPPGIGKDDTSSRRIAHEVGDNMANNTSGVTEIETGPGDTLESVAKGNLQGSGQKVDLGNLLSEQDRIVTQNYDQIKEKMTNQGQDPHDFRTFKGRELPRGVKLKLTTNHTQHSLTPNFQGERQELHPNIGSTTSSDENEKAQQTDGVQAQNKEDSSNFYSGAGAISNTRYALDMLDVGLSDDVKMGISKYLFPKQF